MISTMVATWLVRLAGLYLLLGALFALPFALRWVNRLDEVAAHGTRGFRALLLPGAILLWHVEAPRHHRVGVSESRIGIDPP